MQRRLRDGIIFQLGRLDEVPLCLLVRAERSRALPGAREPVAGLRPDLGCVVGIGHRLIRGEIMRGDDLDHLLLGPALLELGGRCKVASLAVGLRERLVGDLAQEVLQEPVLPVLGRTRIGLDDEHLLARQRAEGGVELAVSETGQRRERLPRERLAEHRRVLDHAALPAGRPSRRAAISACSVSGTSSASTAPVSVYTGPSCTSAPRSSSIRTVSTA